MTVLRGNHIQTEEATALVKVEDIAYVRFRAPDLEQMRAFLLDFGMEVAACDPNTLHMRGSGDAPFLHRTERGEAGFLGLGFRVGSREELVAFAQAAGAAVQPLDAPGGGIFARLTDPDGFEVDVVADQQTAEVDPLELREPWNTIEARPRIGEVKRVAAGPAKVMRLGHCVLNVSSFRASEQWYKSLFGLITSDEVRLRPDLAIGAFLRCDRGDIPTDHHTLFIAQSPKGPGFNHVAFEVRDLDDLMLGHQQLKARGHQHEWGIGRHVLGSQVFDYWRDPWGHAIEHWTDGDLLTAESPSQIATVEDLIAVQWGPPTPPTMG